jgi:hypothetical protein
VTLCHDITAKCDSMACLVAVVEAFTPYAASPAPQRVPGCVLGGHRSQAT